MTWEKNCDGWYYNAISERLSSDEFNVYERQRDLAEKPTNMLPVWKMRAEKIAGEYMSHIDSQERQKTVI